MSAPPPTIAHPELLHAGGSEPVVAEPVLPPPLVREVLELEAMAGAEVLAGHGGLDEPVTGVNIVEVPDVGRWLKGGEFLFTSGIIWRDEPERFGDFVADLGAIGVAGLGVKLGHYLTEVPACAVATADRLGLPIVLIPPDVRYMDVIDPLFRRLTRQRLWLLERSAEAQGAMTSLGLEHQSIERVVAALAEQVQNSVYVTDLDEATVIVAAPGGAATPVRRDELTGPAETAVREASGLAVHRSPTSLILSTGRAVGASLVVDGRPAGSILVVEDGRPFTEFTGLAMAHAGELVSLLLLARSARLAGRLEAGQLFLDSLVSHSISHAEVTERAVSLGLRLTSACTAYVVGPSGAAPDRPLAHAVSSALRGTANVVGTLPTGEVIALVQAAVDAAGGERCALDTATAIGPSGSAPCAAEVLVGRGGPRSGVDGIRRSRSEAIIAYEVGRQRGLTGVVDFAGLGVERVLSRFPQNDVTADFVRMMVGPLEDDPELFRTLRTYLQMGGNKVATAASLQLHRSSLMYRLQKIATLLRADLDDPVYQLELSLAIGLADLADGAAVHDPGDQGGAAPTIRR